MALGVGMRIAAVMVLAAGLGRAFVPAQAQAEPYLMVREGAKCSDCHTNLTGGGKRTAFAQIHAHDILHDLQILPIPPGTKPFTGEVTPYVSIGGDLRTRATLTFRDRPTATGTVDGDRAFRRDLRSTDLSVNEFLAYLQVDLYPDILSIYADENFNGVANNREAFALLRGFLPWNTYFKGGRLFPTYGLRVQDDQAFIRARSGYTFQNPDEGIEIGTMPGPFFIASSITNGKSGDNDVAATLNGYAVVTDVPVVRNVIAGGSLARQTNKRDVYAVYAGSNYGPLTYLAEADKFEDRNLATAGRRADWATYGELDLLLFGWLNLRGTAEFVKVSSANDQTRYAIGAEPFIDRFLQPRIQYRINNGPRDQPLLNQPELWLELHAFF